MNGFSLKVYLFKLSPESSQYIEKHGNEFARDTEHCFLVIGVITYYIG